ncbi:membrane dipeptidase [bacterium BMS3Abin02]|nr:membrane dipeptidase [bacterium BMS3Abin02]GBE21611.1 membrane dipeptidase [bacterium BMS3Bbin01]
MSVTRTERDAALRIHRDLPVTDGHNDLPWAIRVRAGGSLDVADPRTRLDGYHTDFPRLREGGVGAQFWSVYVPAWSTSPLRETIEQIDLVRRMSAMAPEWTELAVGSDDVEHIRASGRIAGLLGAEGGHSIENSLAGLRALGDLGVRYMTLTHIDTIDWADSATDEPRHGGLTDFGRDVVREMNRLAMLVDISHVSVDTMWDALEVSATPVIASHSSTAALASHPRNLPDDVLEAVGRSGGVVMINFYPGFVVAEAAEQSLDLFAEARRLHAELSDDKALEEAMRRMAEDDPMEPGSVADVVDHIEHAVRVAGVDHVGLGSDFDGIDVVPVGLEDVSCYPNVTAELLGRGWDEQAIRNVLGENALRVLRKAEQIAASLS